MTANQVSHQQVLVNERLAEIEQQRADETKGYHDEDVRLRDEYNDIVAKANEEVKRHNKATEDAQNVYNQAYAAWVNYTGDNEKEKLELARKVDEAQIALWSAQEALAQANEYKANVDAEATKTLAGVEASWKQADELHKKTQDQLEQQRIALEAKMTEYQNEWHNEQNRVSFMNVAENRRQFNLNFGIQLARLENEGKSLSLQERQVNLAEQAYWNENKLRAAQRNYYSARAVATYAGIVIDATNAAVNAISTLGGK